MKTLSTEFKLNVAYSKILTSRTEINFFKTISKRTLSCEASRGVYYRSDGLQIKANKSICVVPLKKVELGYIIYLCNKVLNIGEFLYISNWEYHHIKQLGLEKGKDQDFAGWRYFWYAEDILNEFVNPLEKIQKEIREKRAEVENLNDDLEELRTKEVEFLKRFQKPVK